MKNILFTMLTALLLLSVEVAAQSIHFRLPDTTAQVGSSFLLPVYVDSTFTGRNVISYQVQLNYNGNQLLADSLVTGGTLSSSASPMANFGSAGVVTIAAATANPLSGKGVLFYVRFRVVTGSSGYTTSVTFNSTNTYLNQGSPALTFRNATIQVPSLPILFITPVTAAVLVGDSIQFTASQGRAPYTWGLSDTTTGQIASLSPTTSRFVATASGRTRIIATDSNGISGQTSQDIVVHNFRMFTRDSSRLQGTELVLPVYVSSLTPWNVLSGSFTLSLSSYAGLQLIGIERAGTLLNDVNQTFFAQQSATSYQISFAAATAVTGSGILCYLRLAVPNLHPYNFNFTVSLSNVLFNQDLTALVSNSSQTAIALPQIVVNPNTAELVAGETRQFTASNGFSPYNWSVSDSTLATISGNGLLSARQGGVINVTATDSVGATKTTGNIQLYDTRIYVRDTVLIAGDTLVDIAVYMDQLPQGKSISAMSMAFNFDATRLEPLGVLQAGTATAGWSAATNRVSTNRYAIALAGTTPQFAAANLFYIRFRVLPAFVVNNNISLSSIDITLNEGDPNFLLINGAIRSLPCTPVATVSPSGNVSFCANQPTQLSGPTGTAYQYQWSRNGDVIAAATNRLFTPTQSGNYTLKVALNSSCFVVSDTIRVTINPSPVAQLLPYADTLHACSGDTVLLRAYYEPGYTLQWFRNGSTISGATDTIYKAVLSGSYTVRSNLNGCLTTSAAQLINIRPLPAKPTIVVTASPVCAGDSATLHIPTSSLQLQWFSASGAISGATDTVVRVPVGSYTLRLTDNFGCSIYADSVTVTAATASAVIDPSGPTTFCQGGSVDLDLTQPTNYLRWFRNGIQLADTIRPLPVNQGGSYTAAYRLAGNACIFTTPAVTVTVNPRPVVTLDSLSGRCANSPAFVLSGGLPAGGTFVGPGVIGNQFNPAAVGPGTYTIKYGVSQNGCSDTASRTITVLALPGSSFAQPAPVCVSAPAFALSGGLPSGGTYFGVGVSGGNFNPAVVGVGNYVIGYTTQNANGCRDTVFRNMVVNALPVATISQGSTASYCQGGSLTLTANTGTALSYQWLRNGVLIGGQTAANLIVNQSGNYRVVVTNAASCTDTSAITVVTENPLPVSTVTPAGPLTFCQGGSVVLNGISQANQSYRWLRNGSPVIGNLSASLTANTSGVYRLIVTNSITACFDTSAAVNVVVNPLPTAVVTAAGATSICAGDSVTLNVSTGTNQSYQWLLNGSPLAGSTSTTLRVGVGGNYRVIVTNTTTGCFDTTAGLGILVNPLPIATLTPSGPTTFCAGSSVLLVANAGAGLTYNWLWNGNILVGQTGAQLTATQAGAYRVVVTSTAGCRDSSTVVNITVNPKPTTPVISHNIDTLFASPGTDLVWFRNGVLLAGVTDSVLITSQNGSYNALRLFASGCSSDSSNTITIINLNVETQELLAVKIYPNPNQGLLYLELEDRKNVKLELEIRSLTGQLVRQQIWSAGQYPQQLELDLSDLPQAVYLIRLRQGERQRYERIVIQR